MLAGAFEVEADVLPEVEAGTTLVLLFVVEVSTTLELVFVGQVVG